MLAVDQVRIALEASGTLNWHTFRFDNNSRVCVLVDEAMNVNTEFSQILSDTIKNTPISRIIDNLKFIEEDKKLGIERITFQMKLKSPGKGNYRVYSATRPSGYNLNNCNWLSSSILSLRNMFSVSG